MGQVQIDRPIQIFRPYGGDSQVQFEPFIGHIADIVVISAVSHREGST